MSEIYEFMMDADGNGTDDYVVAEEYPDGSILTVADLDGDGLADVATYDVDGDGVAEETYEVPGGYTSLAAEEVSVTYTETVTYTSY
ncbi:hypothetical protein [Catenuloplanes indicus]|uniref:Uncharacterized protein n=1 Tax=Catenuloplanes indicus TaxID=137267 RepID=A0AAE3VVT9_9ACTN|nr:hypothetical protein [Catenuloplanes indicus]MDQ0364659.1 hypothetical protein [Catenuloplanes indicus]